MTIVANTTDADEHPEDRSLLNRRVWLAPICLCLVAVLHLYRVTTAGQTAWKGGGFGMFSTFDAENARFVRAFLLTEDGDRPIEIPAELEKRVAELKTAPNQAGLDTLAQRLAQRTWYDPVIAREHFAAALKQGATTKPLDGEQLRALREVPAPSHPTPAPATPLVANKKSEQRQPIVPFRSVRVELWRFTMPPGTSRLEAGLLYTSIHPADADSTKEASR
jgi:hypothetical protein